MIPCHTLDNRYFLKIGIPFWKSSWYVLQIKSFHLSFLGTLICHNHLYNIDLFSANKESIPNLPLTFSLVTICHRSLQIFLCLAIPTHRNLIWIDVSTLHTPFGIRNIGWNIVEGTSWHFLLDISVQPCSTIYPSKVKVYSEI